MHKEYSQRFITFAKLTFPKFCFFSRYFEHFAEQGQLCCLGSQGWDRQTNRPWVRGLCAGSWALETETHQEARDTRWTGSIPAQCKPLAPMAVPAWPWDDSRDCAVRHQPAEGHRGRSLLPQDLSSVPSSARSRMNEWMNEEWVWRTGFSASILSTFREEDGGGLYVPRWLLLQASTQSPQILAAAEVGAVILLSVFLFLSPDVGDEVGVSLVLQTECSSC